MMTGTDNKHSCKNIWFIFVLQAILGHFIMLKYICKPFIINIAFITERWTIAYYNIFRV